VWIVYDVFVLTALVKNAQATSAKTNEWELHQNKKLVANIGKSRKKRQSTDCKKILANCNLISG
jgi:hypothetical protein